MAVTIGSMISFVGSVQGHVRITFCGSPLTLGDTPPDQARHAPSGTESQWRSSPRSPFGTEWQSGTPRELLFGTESRSARVPHAEHGNDRTRRGAAEDPMATQRRSRPLSVIMTLPWCGSTVMSSLSCFPLVACSYADPEFGGEVADAEPQRLPEQLRFTAGPAADDRHGHRIPSVRNIERSVVPGGCARSAPPRRRQIVPTRPHPEQASHQAPGPGARTTGMR